MGNLIAPRYVPQNAVSNLFAPYLSDMPWAAHSIAQQAVRFGGVNERLFLWVPFQRAIQRVSDERQRADAGRSVAGLDVGNGALSRSDAVKPFLAMFKDKITGDVNYDG